MNHVIWHWKDEYHLDDSIDSQGNSRSSISRDVVWFSPEPQHQKSEIKVNLNNHGISFKLQHLTMQIPIQMKRASDLKMQTEMM